MSSALLRIDGISKTFGKSFRAVNNVSFEVGAGETVGLVGESGCGKTTVARIVLRLIGCDEGHVWLGDRDLLTLKGKPLRQIRPRLQLVPQNPRTSLNPRLTVRQSIEFTMRGAGKQPPAGKDPLPEMLERVDLNRAHAEAYPHELSGGQIQRVAIARAFCTEPDLIVCDEAVSALDKSAQATVLNLLAELQEHMGTAFLFISHDLAVVEHISNRVMVMQQGEIVEQGHRGEIWSNPKHDYTRELLEAVPARPERFIEGGRD